MDELLDLLAADHKRINLTGLQGSSYALIAAGIVAKTEKNLLLFCWGECGPFLHLNP